MQGVAGATGIVVTKGGTVPVGTEGATDPVGSISTIGATTTVVHSEKQPDELKKLIVPPKKQPLQPEQVLVPPEMQLVQPEHVLVPPEAASKIYVPPNRPDKQDRN